MIPKHNEVMGYLLCEALKWWWPAGTQTNSLVSMGTEVTVWGYCMRTIQLMVACAVDTAWWSSWTSLKPDPAFGEVKIYILSPFPDVSGTACNASGLSLPWHWGLLRLCVAVMWQNFCPKRANDSGNIAYFVPLIRGKLNTYLCKLSLIWAKQCHHPLIKENSCNSVLLPECSNS